MDTKTETVSDNELIAEFMGILFDKSGQCTDPEQKYSWRPGCHDPLRIEHLRYDTSWNFLMPVVEKINNTLHPILNERIDVIIYRRTCHINDQEQILIESTGKDMFECTYKAVVEFIHWFNSQPHK